MTLLYLCKIEELYSGGVSPPCTMAQCACAMLCLKLLYEVYAGMPMPAV